MMKKVIGIMIVSVVLPLLVAAADNTQLWKNGTNAYLQKQYDSAAAYFEKIAVSKPANAELYYNLGNVYYRLNRIPQAILNYQRALYIDPAYTDASDNLAVAQARISHHIPATEDIFFISWWKSLTAHTHATSWAIAALLAFCMVIASLWARRYAGFGSILPSQMPGILGFVCALFLLFGIVAGANRARSPGAVVMEDDAPLMNADLKGKPQALIPEGTTVKVGEEKGMWVEVTLPDGRTGYLLQGQVTRI